MTESTIERPRRFHFDWVLPVFFRPGATFKQIAEYPYNSWLTPLLLLSLTGIALVLATGPIRQAAVESGAVLPPDFFYYTPEQQAQFMQAQAGMASPVFIYLFPSIGTLLSVWLGWLCMAGVLHLGLTMLGSRGTTRNAAHLVAWASLFFGVRDIVRLVATLGTQQAIRSPGLAGFAPIEPGFVTAFLTGFLGLIDIYLILFAVWLVLGARAMGGLTLGKAILGVSLTLLVVMALQALPGALASLFGQFGAIRPFF